MIGVKHYIKNMGKGFIKGKYVIVEGVEYPISKFQKYGNFSDNQEVDVIIDTEYPESCDGDSFCMGDETCVVCLLNNKVAIIQ